MIFGLFSSKSSQTATKAEAISSHQNVAKPAMMEARLRGALWGFFAGDALAMPSHWYYGGLPQIKQDYGRAGITGYMQPVRELRGSILNKSNINGGGRGSFKKTSEGVSIIGDVINHGKRKYWDPSKSFHYHATLKAGENTLEAQLARVLMKSIVQNGGRFDANHFRDAYIQFMTTPGSHNDTYCSTCHRMFFANFILKKLPPKDCPDNDMHNVDTIDGLVLPTISALAETARNGQTAQVANVAAETAAVTRNSAALENASRVWSEIVKESLVVDSNDDLISRQLPQSARRFGFSGRLPSGKRKDQMSACYLSDSMPPTLDMLAKYIPEGDAWTGLLANANIGGENVHRGSILGAVLGARASNEHLPTVLKNGLHDKTELAQEIDDFVQAVMGK